jgi:hypothetical protein
MAPERPTFFEGQVLAAADLTGTVEYGRAEAARHDRYLHDWGIAEGLQLTSMAKTDSNGPYVEVTLQPGVAIDGTGREIVVPTPVLLSPTDFAQANGASPKEHTPYPVLLHGRDSDAPASPLTVGACGSASQPTRTQEAFGITFGGLGAELHLDEQPVPDVSAGPGPTGGHLWEILIGFVQWNIQPPRFSAASSTGRRYAGVKADTVAARSGTLVLRAQPIPTPGQPALLLGGDPPTLTFGLYKGGNTVDARLTVNAQGDVTATGTIKGALTQGEIRVQSGTATDGVIIPLPPGITQGQVTRGAVILHLHLAPHTPPAVPTGAWWIPLECRVDQDQRLECLVRTFTAPGTSTDVSGAADYLLIATVGSTAGANP